MSELTEEKAIAEALAMANVNSALLIAEVEEKNEQIEISKQQMQKLLDHLRLAVFSVGRDGLIVPPVSSHSRVIFDQDIEGRHIVDTLFRDVETKPDIQSLFELLERQPSSSSLPRQLKFGERHLKTQCTPIMDRDGTIEKLMFVSEDVTELVEYESRLSEQRELAQKSRTAQLESEKKALLQDLELTGAVQSLLLPARKEFETDRLAMCAYYETARQASGDWWWYEDRGGERLRILMGDVTGHGTGSAMVTAAIASSYRTIQAISPRMPVPEVLSRLNQSMLEFCASTYWMTFCVVEIDGAEGQVRIWNAGAPPILIGCPTGEVRTVNLGASSPLGSEDFRIREQELTLAPGETLMAMTDGLFEFEMEDDRLFNLKRLKAEYSDVLKQGALQAQRDSLVSNLGKLRRHKELEDDASFVMVRLG